MIPEWVQDHVRQAAPNAKILNIREARKGYLANTSEGAAFVTKAGFADPQTFFLPLPANRSPVACTVCGNRMVFVEPEYPKQAYCSQCGALHRLHADGSFQRIGEAQQVPIMVHAVTAPIAQTTPPIPAPVTESKGGPFTHKGFTLYERENQLKGGGTTTFYFFSKRTPKSGSPCAMPDGYEVQESTSGMLYLKRIGSKKAKAQPQCGGVTGAGAQCRNSAREGSKYCASHKGYRAKTEAALDTKPRAKRAKDTLPSVKA